MAKGHLEADLKKFKESSPLAYPLVAHLEKYDDSCLFKWKRDSARGLYLPNSRRPRESDEESKEMDEGSMRSTKRLRCEELCDSE